MRWSSATCTAIRSRTSDASLPWPAPLRSADAGSFPETEALQRELLDELTAADALLVETTM